jgi:hypothetical protein
MLKLFNCFYNLELSRKIYVIGKQETVTAGTVLMRKCISEENTCLVQSVITSDSRVVNIFFVLFFTFTGLFREAEEILLKECRKLWGKTTLSL